MFISQVIFETERANEDTLKWIMQKKKTNTTDVTGLLSAEYWWKGNTDTVQFALVTKWNDKETFQDWLKQSHTGGHKRSDTADRPSVTKTAYQFELVE